MMLSSVITLTTDFGLSDSYVASVKGAILSINPSVTIVDISHFVEPRNIPQAAFILNTAHRYFPDGTIHVVIVDPGVGSHRNAIIIRTSLAYFLAPDNGVLSYLINDICPNTAIENTAAPFSLEPRDIRGYVEVVSITNPVFWRQPVSTTFHGRDIFAPVAAHLSLGVSVDQFGKAIDFVNVFAEPQLCYGSRGILYGYILHIDNFGNLITNVKAGDLPNGDVDIEIGNHIINGVNRFYAEKEGLAAIVGSCGYLEISFTNGNAAFFLGAKVGDKLKLIIKDDQI